MKKLTIVAYAKQTCHQYVETLQSLFGDILEVDFCFPDRESLKRIDADIILSSTYSTYELIKRHVPNVSSTLIADLTLKKESMDQLKAFPYGTKAALLNVSMEMAIDTIATIDQYGIKNIDFVPTYPPLAEDFPHSLVVTPGETLLVPQNVERVIDLGDRILSMKTITEIAILLDSIQILRTRKFQDYFDSIIASDVSVFEMLNQINLLEQKLDLILQVFDSGVITINQQGLVTFANPLSAKLLETSIKNMVGSSIETLMPSLLKDGATPPIGDTVISVRQNLLIASIHLIQYTSVLQGYLILVKKFTDVEKEQYKIRRQVMAKGHIAKYTFNDIIGNSPIIQQTKSFARRIADSNSAVLIYGQSGTGKELFAQSIHNASYRKNYPFIAINCAAIPEALLESELFGYAEGAFTGAKKGGKSGYFEQAHGGTLFLDEISEMNINLQTRLLRVLQEKEVIRIGGDSVISIDVRIIAASNKKLKDLVRQGLFRQDLFYRLNVLSLNIPSLSSHKEDIPLLIEKMKDEFNANFVLEPSAVNLIQGTHFEGNIRELRNLVERLQYAGTDRIDAEGVRKFLDESSPAEVSWSAEEADRIQRFARENQDSLHRCYAVLEVLASTYHNSVKLGRKSVSELLSSQDISFSEQEIRTIFHVLAEHHLIHISRGRGGTYITDFGMKAYTYFTAQQTTFH